MTTRGEHIRHQVQERVKQAVVQMDHVRGRMVQALADRLELDLDDLRDRRNAVLRTVHQQSDRLAHQDTPYMPELVRRSLGRFHGLLDQVVEGLDPEPPPVVVETREAKADVATPKKRRSGDKHKPRGRGGRRPRRTQETQRQ